MPAGGRNHARTFGWEVLLLVLPVLALVGFGVLALGWERRAEREDLRARCRALVTPLRADFYKGMQERSVLGGDRNRAGLSGGGKLPLPVEEHASLEQFREGDFDRVLGGSSSRSAAGLPLRPLAALRLLRRESDPERLEELSELMAAEPSLVTPRLLREAEERHRALGLPLPKVLQGWEERLERQEDVSELLEKEGAGLLAPSEMMRWIVQGDRMWLALRAESEILLVEKAQVSDAVQAAVAPLEASLPAGVEIEFQLRGAGLDRVPVLVEVAGVPPVRFVIADARALQGASAGRRVLFSSFLGLAGILSLVGVILLLRTAARERELSERKGNLVAAVSHEMRTPVASIRLLAENLHSGVVSTEGDREKHLDRVVEQAERLSTLVENVLSYSRREAGREEGADEEIDVEGLLKEALEPFRVIAENRRVVLSTVAGELGETPRGDPAALREALVNLIDNGIKHSPEGGEVTCGAESCAERAGSWRLWVTDEGSGVKKEEQEKVFEAFYRVGSELRRETAGTGLGLALVKQVAESHGGRAVCRRGASGGARFELLLPFSPARKDS